MESRRGFFAQALVLSALPFAVKADAPPRFANRKRYYGKFDFQDAVFEPIELSQSRKGIVLLDGKEIKSVCSANTDTGILRTFDVLHDGSTATTTIRYPKVEDLESHAVRIVDVTSNAADTEWRQKIATYRVWKPEDFPGRDVHCPPEGVLCEALHGVIEIWGPEL